jgi:hypothetical protein
VLPFNLDGRLSLDGGQSATAREALSQTERIGMMRTAEDRADDVALISPVNGRELGVAIPAAFRRRGLEKPNQHECTKRRHRDAARQNHFDVVAVGLLEPFAHLFLPPGIT